MDKKMDAKTEETSELLVQSEEEVRVVDHTDVLWAIAQTLPQKKWYLELGVASGVSFSKIAPEFENSIGVDIGEYPGKAFRELASKGYNNAQFCRKSTDQFFIDYHEDTLFDLIFIDADHAYEQSKKDFLNAAIVVRPETGLIVLHDTYPPSSEFLNPKYCGDTWKTAQWIRNNVPEFECVTLPGFYGLTICRKAFKQVHWMD